MTIVTSTKTRFVKAIQLPLYYHEHDATLKNGTFLVKDVATNTYNSDGKGMVTTQNVRLFQEHQIF